MGDEGRNSREEVSQFVVNRTYSPISPITDNKMMNRREFNLTLLCAAGAQRSPHRLSAERNRLPLTV
jgi:hypothetical protein